MSGPGESQGMPVVSSQIPRATLEALTRLTSQIASLNDHLVAQGSTSTQGSVQAARQSVADRVQATQLGTTSVTSGGLEVPAQAAGAVSKQASEPPPPATPTQVPFLQRLAQARKGIGNGGFSSGFLNPDIAQREIPTSGSFPPESPSGVIPGVSREGVGKMQTEKFEIPPFGEWQLDTKLKMARDWLGQFALNQGEYDENGDWQWNEGAKAQLGKRAATVSGYLNYASGYAANIHAAHRGLDKAINFGEGMSEMGASLGYSPQSGIGPSAIAGIRNPLSFFTSEAGQQGGGAFLDAEKMARIGTGITSGQAKEIYGALSGMGFSNQQSGFLGLTTGGDLENIATQLVAPIVKNTGMSPEVASQFANALRNGNTSIKELSETLTNLPSAAQSAREGINEYGESLQSFAEGAEQFGATKQQGYESGIGFTAATGLDPRLLGQMQSSPLFQGLALTQMGVLPSGLGALPGGSQTSLTLQAMNMAMNATRGLGHTTYQNIGGKQIETMSGEQAQMAQAAQLLGIPREEFERLHRNAGRESASANALTLLQADTGQGWKRELAGMMAKTHGHLTQEDRNLLQHGGNGVTGWSQISQQLLNAKISPSEVSHLAGEGFDKRAKDVESLLAKINKEKISETGQNQVAVKFTGPAARFFEQVPLSGSKAKANAGGPSLTSIATSPLKALDAISNPVGSITGGIESLAGDIL